MPLINVVMTPRGSVPVQELASAKKWPKPLLRCTLLLLVLLLAFGKPLWDLARYAFGSELYSHVLLIPVIVGYLIALRRKELPAQAQKPMSPPDHAPGFSVFPFMFALASLGVYASLVWQGRQVSLNDYLTLTIFSFVCFALGISFLTLGARTLRPIAYPLAMLFFMVPFPEAFTAGIENFLQHSSAEAANLLFTLTGQTFVRHDLIFQLPGITPLEVAPECSGIRSSLVLFISSLVAGYLFLRSPWKRTILALSVVPLGILRNGIRIVTIGMLCANVDPGMIDSPIHRHGGPLFFLLSLIPFFILLFYLRHLEIRRRKS